MSEKIFNPNFFKSSPKKADKPSNDANSTAPVTEAKAKVRVVSKPEKKQSEERDQEQPCASPIRIVGRIPALLEELTSLLNKTGQKSLITEVNKIKKELERKKFTVAVVGEFSKGKSTFINKFLGKDFLPTGNLPTTAMLTKIRYNPKEMLILFDKHGNKKKVLPLSESSWDGLTADIMGSNDPDGVVLAGVNSPWLKKTGVEIEDTPGAGDLEENRAKLIGEALLCDDGAVITISATAAMSMSEKLFIEQRLVAQKTPYLMMIITKLDQVPLEERAGIIDYVKQKLTEFKREIPLFIPYDIEMPDDRYADITGIDKIQKEIERWVSDPQREELVKQWLLQRVQAVIAKALSSLKEQEILIQADEDKRQNLIEEKKAQLSRASVVWDQLRLGMQKKASECFEKLQNIIDDNKVRITERLQYEVSHAGNPEKWWKEDYPYRIKVEIMNMSNNIEAFVSRNISEDMRWFNAMLDKQFKTHVLVGQGKFGEANKPFSDIDNNEDLEFEDITKKRNMARVGVAAMTVASYALLPLIGFNPIVASIGIGTGSGIITEKLFKGKIEKQQVQLKEIIGTIVPQVIDKATTQTEERINARYDEIINAAKEQEDVWMQSQEEAIENSLKCANPDAKAKLEENIANFDNISKKILTT